MLKQIFRWLFWFLSFLMNFLIVFTEFVLGLTNLSIYSLNYWYSFRIWTTFFLNSTTILSWFLLGLSTHNKCIPDIFLIPLLWRYHYCRYTWLIWIIKRSVSTSLSTFLFAYLNSLCYVYLIMQFKLYFEKPKCFVIIS